MIGNVLTDKDGYPLDSKGNKLSESAYNPSEEIKTLFARVMTDYQTAWVLQHRPLREFDGQSLLTRSRLDQETFGAFVGAEWVPEHKKWRWKGRKNTARNKLIGILAHMIAGMLYPTVFAKNERDEEDRMTAKAMSVLCEDALKKAGYETDFLFMVLSALVNPAVHVGVEYVQAMQMIKQKVESGKYEPKHIVDELMSGLFLNIIPIDECLPTDYYTPDPQHQSCFIRVRRIPYDQARAEYAGKHFDKNGKDLFDYVEAGKTRVVMASQEHQVLYDIEWTESERLAVQVITAYYRLEDLETVWVGGVFMGNEDDPYNSNPFTHRRFSLVEDEKGNKEWASVPILPIAKAYFEPIDPTGRFYFGKSGAFKEYWDSLSQDRMYQIFQDGTFLDVMKPIFGSGVGKVDSSVLVPGAFVPLPQGAVVTPYSLSPNLASAMSVMNVNKDDMAESTQDKIMSGMVEKGVTAYATSKAEQNARIFLGVFGVFIAKLIKEVGELVVDCLIMNTTVGELDASMPEALRMKYKPIITKGKEKGKNVTHRFIFTDKYMGREKMTEAQIKDTEFDLYDKAGGEDSEQRIWEINPYRFARTKYSFFVDADKMIMRSTGADELRKQNALTILTNPMVAPWTDQEAVINDFAIEPLAEGDPDRYKKKKDDNNPMNAILGAQPPTTPQPFNNNPMPQPMAQ